MEMSKDELEIWEWTKNNRASVMLMAKKFHLSMSEAHTIHKKGGKFDRDKESK